MRHDEAHRYHDRALAYLHGTRHGVRAATAARPVSREDEAHIAIAIEGDGDERRIVLRVKALDNATLRTIKVMRELGHVPSDVRVEEVGLLSGHGAQDAVSPIRPGVACANEHGPSGTLGCFLDSDDGKLILSANHVLALENRALKGSSIVQPKLGIVGEREIALLHDAQDLFSAGNLMDAAVAKLTVNDINSTIFNNVDINGVRTTPLVTGETLTKFGQSTEERSGNFLSMTSNVSLKMRFDTYSFDDQIEINSTGQPFSAGGDSGALVYDDQKRAVGIVIGGNNSNRSFVTPIARILERFNATLS